MQRDDVLSILTNHQMELRNTYGVKSLALFGSVARDEAGPDSDVDILVEFDRRPVGLFEFIDLQLFLEQILATNVDLATPNSLSDWMKQGVQRDLVNVH